MKGQEHLLSTSCQWEIQHKTQELKVIHESPLWRLASKYLLKHSQAAAWVVRAVRSKGRVKKVVLMWGHEKREQG